MAETRWLWTLTALWVASIPTLFVLGNRGLTTVPIFKPDRVLWVVLVGLLMARMLRQRALPPIGPLETAVAVYTAIMLLSWMTTIHAKTWETLKRDGALLCDGVLMPATALVLGCALAWSKTRVLACLWVLVGAVGTYLIISGLGEYLYQWDVLTLVQPIVQRGRVTGPFSNALEYGMVASTLLLLALFLYEHARPAGRAILLGIGVGLLQGIIFSKGRAVWVALPMALLFMSVRRPRTRRLALAATALLAVEILSLRSLGLGGVLERVGDVTPMYNRVAVYVTAANMIIHHPLLGFGFGATTFGDNKAGYVTGWGPLSREWVARWVRFPTVPHDEFLHVLVLTGFVGLAAYVWVQWVGWRELGQHAVRSLPRQASNPSWASSSRPAS